MNDQFDLYCFYKLGRRLAEVLAAPDQADDISCACANYLSDQGYVTADITHFPTTSTVMKGETK